ncbi:AP-4 complex subunit epsilon-1-like [Oopsacas minuta]|uniref:AP-4 complex subunit epsilon-1-like n=1 Tax=Oopsacas minuta TaxID=111878 RepID=A0AAV7K6C6_9METZ|nr:AP-4 complex subunit epsilon-1-like [Oopsacas minuta]
MAKQLGRITEFGLGIIPLPGHSRTFQLLIRHIGEARTKYEEDKIVEREVTFLKQNISAPVISVREQMEFIIRMIYVEMLGHDASFGYIQAVKLTQHGTLMARRLGYMASAMFMHKNPDLGMMIVNSLQKDLSCQDIMRISMALICLGHTVTREMLPVVLPLVKECLSHPKELVRKKAIVVLYKLYKQQNINEGASNVLTIESAPLVSLVERCLSDRDPGVMSSGLSVLYKLVLEEPGKFKGLVDSMVNILMQIVTHRVSIDFEYHSVVLPWTQIKMLQILSIIGQDDLSISKRIYEVLDICLARANQEASQLIGKALIFECVRTISCIYPDTELIMKAAGAVGRFLSSPSNNIQYFGITSLSLLVQVEPQHALEHQEVIMRCLDDPDDTLKRKTLELLCRITGPENVSVICSKLTEYLESVTDQFIRGDLARKITEIAEKHAPNHEWFLVTVSRVFRLAGDLVPHNVAHNLMRLIAEGIDSGDASVEKEFRIQAVTIFSNILIESDTNLNIPDSLIRIVAWVLAEYVYLCPNLTHIDIASRLAKVFREGKRSAVTQNWIIQSVIKLALHDELVRNSIDTLFAQSNLILNIDTQQRWNEYNGMLSSKYRLDTLHPLDGSCEDMGVDSTLGFLTKFSREAERTGAPAYKPPHSRKEDKPPQKIIEINYKPYEAPPKPAVRALPTPAISNIAPKQMNKFTPISIVSPEPVLPSTQPPEGSSTQFHSNQSINRPWSTKGYQTKNSELNSFEPKKFPPTKLSSNFTNYKPDTTISTVNAHPTVHHEDPKRKEANSIFAHLAPQGTGGVLSQTGRKPKKNTPTGGIENLLEPQLTNLIQPEVPNQNSVLVEREVTPLLVPNSETPLFSDTLLDPTIELDNTELVPEPKGIKTESVLSELNFDNESGFAFINESFPLTNYNPPSKGPEMNLELNEFPKDEQNFLVSDVNIRVTYVKVFKPETLVLFLVITNQIQDALQDIHFKYQFPSNLRHLESVTNNHLTLEGLEGFESHPETLEIRCTAPAMNPTVSGELSYKDTRKTQQRLFFNLLITTRDLMRPLNLTPIEFQNEWSSSHMFRKKMVTISPAGIPNISEFITFFRQKLNVQEIDRNKNELLFAGTFLSKVKCLFHANFNDELSSAEIKVLSKNNLLNDSIAHFLEKNLK